MKPEARRSTLAEAAIFVPAPGGSARLLLEAGSSGCAIADPAGLAEQPELAAASVARLVEDEALRSSSGEKARATALQSDFAELAKRLEDVYTHTAGRRRAGSARDAHPTAIPSATATGSSSTSTCTPTTPTTARSTRRRW